MTERRIEARLPLRTHDVIREKILKKFPNSILTIAPDINNAFGAGLSDDTTLDSVVVVSIDPQSGSKSITFSQFWENIKLKPKQKEKIGRIFLKLFSSGGTIDTIGDIRKLAEERAIWEIVGLHDISEIFLIDSFKRAETVSG